MSCPWSHHSTCEQVGNMVHGTDEDVYFVSFVSEACRLIEREVGRANNFADFVNRADSVLPTPLPART